MARSAESYATEVTSDGSTVYKSIAHHSGIAAGSTSIPDIHPDALHSVWIQLEDAVDVLRLSGLSATDTSLGASVKSMRVFLPGHADQRLSFQVCVDFNGIG